MFSMYYNSEVHLINNNFVGLNFPENSIFLKNDVINLHNTSFIDILAGKYSLISNIL